ncbi:MAG: DUF3298 and DUF4163 domain-containing protein [Lachnospiraceae bacterium]|nr:DUF3298 and DUF4163 domain-containing protein [Lachnospiraceae bacterium]
MHKLLRSTMVAILALILTACGATGGEQQVAETSPIQESIPEAAAETTTQEAEEQSPEEAYITISHYPVSCVGDGMVWCTGSYAQIKLSEEYESQYPELARKLEEYNNGWKESAEQSVAEFSGWAIDYLEEDLGPFNYDTTADVLRSDDRMFTIFWTYEAYSGGAHPNHGVAAINIDPTSGQEYRLDYMLKDPSAFPALVREKMEAEYPGIMEEVDSFYFGDGEVFEEKLDEDTFTWDVTDKGLELHFSPYEIASYATGYLYVALDYKDYPDLVKDEFKPSAPFVRENALTETEEDAIYVQPYIEPEADLIENPSWEGFCHNENVPENVHILSLEKIREDTSDWLPMEDWAAATGFEPTSMSYEDENYYYSYVNEQEYSYMFTELLVYDITDDGYELKLDYNLYDLANGPDEELGYYSNVTQYILHAQLVEDILYVSLGFNGYSSEEPFSNYVVAIDINTNEVLWRSEPLVCNADDFQVVGDTLICGYGFTAEADYINLLNRYTGKVEASYPVVTAPSRFGVRDGVLYVATYNTAYEFRIVE